MESGYLTADELADLVDCRPNQRSIMIAWLQSHHWRFEVARTGVPRVARAYHDLKMGITEGKHRATHTETPNLDAFGT